MWASCIALPRGWASCLSKHCAHYRTTQNAYARLKCIRVRVKYAFFCCCRCFSSFDVAGSVRTVSSHRHFRKGLAYGGITSAWRRPRNGTREWLSKRRKKIIIIERKSRFSNLCVAAGLAGMPAEHFFFFFASTSLEMSWRLCRARFQKERRKTIGRSG